MAPRKKAHERSIFECVIIIKIKIKIKVKTVSNWENLKAKKKERKSTVSVAISSWERLTYCLYITSFLPFLNRWVTCGKIKHLMALKMARQPLFFILYYFNFFQFPRSRSALSLCPQYHHWQSIGICRRWKVISTKQIDPVASVVEIRRGHCWWTTH